VSRGELRSQEPGVAGVAEHARKVFIGKSRTLTSPWENLLKLPDSPAPELLQLL
jgi:hypothetical protein